MVSKWVPKQYFELEPNPSWIGPRPGIEQVRMRIIEENKTAELAFQAREVHMTSVSPDSVPILKDSLPDDAVLVQKPGLVWTWISMNVEHPKLTDKRMCYAINHAVDRDDVTTCASP